MGEERNRLGSFLIAARSKKPPPLTTYTATSPKVAFFQPRGRTLRNNDRTQKRQRGKLEETEKQT